MTDPIRYRPPVPPVFLAVIALCVAVQLLSEAAPALREWLLLHGALWPQLFEGVRPMFPASR